MQNAVYWFALGNTDFKFYIYNLFNQFWLEVGSFKMCTGQYFSKKWIAKKFFPQYLFLLFLLKTKKYYSDIFSEKSVDYLNFVESSIEILIKENINFDYKIKCSFLKKNLLAQNCTHKLTNAHWAHI